MTKINKEGLDYFSFDVNFFTDEKIEFISARFGTQGEIITIKLLCKIYRNGYYLKWGEDECLLFSRRVGEGITVELIDDVVKELLKRNFLDRKRFEKYKILTSRGIQKRYLNATKRRKEVTIFKEYLLLNSQNVNNISQNVCIIPLNVNIYPQSKVKQRKEKKSKKDKILCQDSRESPDPANLKIAYKATCYLIDRILANNPRARAPNKDPTNALMKKWVAEMGRLHRLGPIGAEESENKGYSWKEIKKIINWCQDDNFWKTNILSAAKLREKIITLENKTKGTPYRKGDRNGKNQRYNTKRDGKDGRTGKDKYKHLEEIH